MGLVRTGLPTPVRLPDRPRTSCHRWTVTSTELEVGQRRLTGCPIGFAGVNVIGVEAHILRDIHTGNKYVTVIVDLTPLQRGTGKARLLEMIHSRYQGGVRDLA